MEHHEELYRKRALQNPYACTPIRIFTRMQNSPDWLHLFQRILSFHRWTSTSPCLCCSVSPRISSTTSCWTGAPSARALWSRCATWQLSPFPLTPLQFTARANPSTLCWERHLSWTACRRAATGPSVSRWAFVYTEIEELRRVVFDINLFFFLSLSSGKPSPSSCGPSCDLWARLDPETGDRPGQQVQGKISLHHAPG